ncbi:MAG: DUF2283 domain-containing protein [Rubrobacteraceae bacterium]|nr:DUF2283 domain-containing protein [Rubrobacteraceae bacterium]
MRFRYDPQSGALYFRLREGKIEETLDLPSPGGYMDVDPEGNVMGLEFLSLQEYVTFLSGFGGEVELPERVDADAYDEAMRRAFEEVPTGETPADVLDFFRETFLPRTNRERAGGV